MDPIIEMLDRYLDGDLAAEELKDLMARLGDHPDGVRLLAVRSELHTGLRRSLLRRSLQRGARVHSPGHGQESTRRALHRGGMIAAGLVVALASGWLYFTFRSPDAIATLESFTGEAFLLTAGERIPATSGQELLPGEGLETGRRSGASLRFPDGTVLTLEGDTRVAAAEEGEAGKRLTVEGGSLGAKVARQPEGRPMVVATPHGEARILGTTLRIAVYPGSTRLEVIEGKVRLSRKVDPKAVDVLSGHYAVAEAGMELTAKPILLKPVSIDDVVLVPQDGKIFGAEWKQVTDAGASTGFALEAASTSYLATSKPFPVLRDRRDFVAFTFPAEADKDYFVWIRARCTAAEDRTEHDSVALEPGNGKFSETCHNLGLPGDSAFVFLGWGWGTDYHWISGDMVRAATGRGGEPVAIRFSQPGPQTLKLYAIRCPMRVDAIWLSSTKNVRPGAAYYGPPAGRR